MEYPEIKISLDGNKWVALIGENLHDGEAFFGDSPYEVLQLALESLPDYRVHQSATVRFFEFEKDALDVRFAFYPPLDMNAEPSVITKAVDVCIDALRANQGDQEPSRIIVP